MKNSHNWSFIEMYNLPVALRKWFVNRYAEMVRKQNEKNNKFTTN